jgi:predicted ester cyclase
LLDAPPTIGNNIRRGVDEIASANGVSNKINYLIYSHHHADHVGASSLFDKNVTRIGHAETRRLLLRDNDPARPPNEETFQDRRTLQIGGERIDLAWHGANHSPDNIIIHLPDHDTLLLGREAVLEYHRQTKRAIPNIGGEYSVIVAVGEMVGGQKLVLGTNTGPMAAGGRELPPTGRKIELPESDWMKSEGGRCVHHWIYYDRMSLLEQLGLLPAK